MRKLRQYGNWFVLLIKRQLKRPGIYLLTGLFLLFLFIFQQIVFPEDRSLTYGIMNGGAECGDAVIRDLRDDDLYTAVRVSSYAALERGVSSGRLDCGFVLKKGLDDVSGVDNLAGTIDYVSSTSTVYGPILKEKVLAAVLRETTRKMLADIGRDDTLYVQDGVDSDQLVQTLSDAFDYYLDSDETIRVEYETVEVDGAAAAKKDSYPESARRFIALIGILVFAAAVVFGRLRFSEESARFSGGLLPGMKRVWRFLEILAPVLLITLALSVPLINRLLAIGCAPGHMVQVLLLLLLSAVLSALWAFVYALLFSSERYYISSIPLVLILCIVTNPQIFAGVPLGRMLTVLGRIFPAWVVRI